MSHVLDLCFFRFLFFFLWKPVQAVEWTEHKAPDGRVYYFNKGTGQSLWDKPEELKSEEEKALPVSPWKEHVSDAGKKYYFNSVTKQSLWEIPKEHQGTLPPTHPSPLPSTMTEYYSESVV